MPFDGRKRLTPVADKARECLGPNGERWARSGYGYHSGGGCIAQAVVRGLIGKDITWGCYQMSPEETSKWFGTYRQLLAKALRIQDDSFTIFDWNDSPARTFADIEAALARFADLEAEMNMEKTDAV